MRAPSGGALGCLVAASIFALVFELVSTLTSLLSGEAWLLCQPRERTAGCIAQQMVFHLFQEWEQSDHALLGDGRVLGIVGG